MRTLQIGDLWLSEEQGGLSRYYYELLAHLPAVGVQSRGLVVGSAAVKTASNGSVIPFATRDQGLLNRMWAARSEAQWQIKDFQPELLVSHFAIYAAPLIDVFARRPNVVHFHGPWAGESNVEGIRQLAARAKQMLESCVYRRATRLIVLSDAFRQELIRNYRVPEERIRIVPGGVDVHRFNMTSDRATARDLLGWPRDRPILLTVRRQVKRMGLENLIEAAAQIAMHVPEVLVLLGGVGPISNDLKRQVEERQLQNNVQFLGRIDDADLPTAYRAANLTVVPTVALEGFGLITLESLASGTPVYVTPVGGLSEVVRPFDPSCIFDATSVNAIASRLIDCLTGKQAIPSEDDCRAYAFNHFSWPQIAGKVKGVYAEALQSDRG